MKKILATLLTICMIETSTAFVFPIATFAESETVTIYVSADGSDENAGTYDAPVATIGKAISLVDDNGTIVINGTVAPANNTAFAGSKLGKTVTVTSGENGVIDLTGLQFAQLKNNMTFENISLKFTSSYYLFACGYKLVIDKTVTFAEGSGAPHVFGGAYQAKSGSTDITLLAGTYTNVYGGSHDTAYTINGDTNVHFGGTATATSVTGGSNKGTVTGNSNVLIDGDANVKTIYGASSGTVEGNTYVTVKGNANPNAAPSDDSHDGGGYKIYGGGNGTVKGSTHVYFMDNAKAGYVVGGTSGTSGAVGGTANVYMMGGTTYSVYGAGITTAAEASISANIVMTGGTAWQVFGGCESASVTGDITIKLLGGTIKRRVYGGCYNETSGLSFGTSYAVTGNVTLVIDSGVTIDFSSTDNDRSIYAHSRHNSPSSAEVSAILFTNSTAYNTYNSKLKAQDTAMKLIMGSASAADSTHTHTYTVNGNVITQSCTCGNTATATVTANNAIYSGEKVNTSVEYSNWEYDEFDVEHFNNVNAGTATATFTVYNNQIHSVNYSILKASQKAPVVKAENNTIKGLATTMEYSSDNGATYTAVTNPAMTFESGKYYVRYAENANYAASNAVKLFFGTVISANKVSALCGKTVEIIISIPSNSGTSALDITVGYDKDIFELTSITSGNVVAVTGDTENGKITWTGDTTTKNGLLAKLTFKVSETAEKGDYAITLTNQNGISIVNGAISVVEYVTGDVSGDDGKITISDIVDLRNAIVNAETGALASGADANGDGAVDVQDLIVIRQYIANYDYDEGESSVILGGAQ